MNRSFKTWKTIEVDYRKGLDDYDDELKVASVAVHPLCQKVFNNLLFLKENKRISVDLVRINLYEMKRKYGISLLNSNEDIINHFCKLGLHNCDIQTALQLSVVLKQRTENVMTKAVTKLIQFDQEELQFVQFRRDGQRYLALVDNKNLMYNFFVPTYLVFRK